MLAKRFTQFSPKQVFWQKNRLWRRWLGAFLLGYLSLAAPAQQNTYPFNFAFLNKENGLPHNICHTGKRDRRGFMWFGTQDGLARYDGVNFKVYGQRPDSTGLSAPTVLDIDEDADGYLWIATLGGGLNRFDPVTESFRWYRHDPGDPSSLPGDDLVHLWIDQDGSIWVSAFNTGFSHFDPRTGRFQNFNLAENLPTKADRFRLNSVYDIAGDSEEPDALWLAASNGIYRFTKSSGWLQHFPSPASHTANMACRDVLADQTGVVWIATNGGGIACFQKKSRQWEYFPPLPGEWAKRNTSTNLIYDISRKSGHEFWVASLDMGFGIFDLRTGRYNWFESQPKLPPGQRGQSVNGLYGDPAGLLWIFNYKSGISVLDPARNVFEYTAMPATGCDNPQLNAPRDFAWNAARQELYVVAEGCRGFYVFRPQARSEPTRLSGQAPYRLEYTLPSNAAGSNVNFQCLLVDRRERVWIGGGQSRGLGMESPSGSAATLYQYYPEQRRMTPFRHPFLNLTPIHQYSINAIAEDAGGNLWLATRQGGLIKIDFQRDTLEQFLRGDDFDGAHTDIADLQFDPQGRLWLATWEAGVFCFDPMTRAFTHFAQLPGQKHGLVENRCQSLAIDERGNVWVGTDNHGFQMIQAGAAPGDALPNFTVQDGLAFNKLHHLVYTPEGQLWISTEKGISRFSEANRTFANYDESDGLADTYLNGKGFRYCANGEIFVGQPSGFYCFRPHAMYRNHLPPALVFTGFRLFSENYATGKDLNFQPEIRLRHDQNFFTIQFAALNFSQPEHNRYWYKLDDYAPDWFSSGNRADASYTKLPPGDYVFRVRAQNNSGVAAREELALHVHIAPAFYQTNWFVALVVLALGALVLGLFSFRLNLVRRQEAAKTELNRLRAVKAELETRALRSQMNPHFVFNGMNTIEALIVEEKPEEASALLQKFSKLFRAVLENSQHSRVTLALELDALELYVQLEAIRLDGRFQHRIEVSPALDRARCLIPPLILQPFVENAVLHGLRHLPGRNGRLEVRIEALDDKLVCSISDNGIGRAKSAELNARNRLKNKKQSLGTKLTTERIELLNPPGRRDYRVKFTDLQAPGLTGTIVTVTLPLEFTQTENLQYENHPR